MGNIEDQTKRMLDEAFTNGLREMLIEVIEPVMRDAKFPQTADPDDYERQAAMMASWALLTAAVDIAMVMGNDLEAVQAAISDLQHYATEVEGVRRVERLTRHLKAGSS